MRATSFAPRASPIAARCDSSSPAFSGVHEGGAAAKRGVVRPKHTSTIVAPGQGSAPPPLDVLDSFVSVVFRRWYVTCTLAGTLCNTERGFQVLVRCLHSGWYIMQFCERGFQALVRCLHSGRYIMQFYEHSFQALVRRL